MYLIRIMYDVLVFLTSLHRWRGDDDEIKMSFPFKSLVENEFPVEKQIKFFYSIFYSRKSTFRFAKAIYLFILSLFSGAKRKQFLQIKFDIESLLPISDGKRKTSKFAGCRVTTVTCVYRLMKKKEIAYFFSLRNSTPAPVSVHFLYYRD